MTPGDFTQVPVEHLAQLLLRHARQDLGLARRSAANDDDMLSRTEALPALQGERPLRLPPGPADPANLAALEELVAVALGAAQDAEDLSLETSKRARRGMAIAIAVGIASVAASAAGMLVARQDDGAANQMAAIAGQIRSLQTLQHRISDQLASLQTPAGVQEASAVPYAQPGNVSRGVLTPLPVTHVSVLPAHVAIPVAAPDGPTQPYPAAPTTVPEPAPPSGTPAPRWRSADLVAPLPGADPALPRHDHAYRVAFVMPPPMARLVGQLRRDVSTAFRY